MTKPAEGVGTAHNTTVVVENNVEALSAALEAARQAQEDSIPARDLANARTKVAKYRAHLATAEAEVARLEGNA